MTKADKKEGDKGVKERRLQIDRGAKNDYFYFTENDYVPALFHHYPSIVLICKSEKSVFYGL